MPKLILYMTVLVLSCGTIDEISGRAFKTMIPGKTVQSNNETLPNSILRSGIPLKWIIRPVSVGWDIQLTKRIQISPGYKYFQDVNCAISLTCQ